MVVKLSGRIKKQLGEYFVTNEVEWHQVRIEYKNISEKLNLLEVKMGRGLLWNSFLDSKTSIKLHSLIKAKLSSIPTPLNLKTYEFVINNLKSLKLPNKNCSSIRMTFMHLHEVRFPFWPFANNCSLTKRGIDGNPQLCGSQVMLIP